MLDGHRMVHMGYIICVLLDSIKKCGVEPELFGNSLNGHDFYLGN